MLFAAVVALALTGCGGDSHTASTAAADINGAPVRDSVGKVAASTATASSVTTVSTATATTAPANSGVPYTVSTISMEPAYKAETTVYYDPTRTRPKIGDVIVFHLPTGAEHGSCLDVPTGGAPCRSPVPGLLKRIGFKRVVGLPGDTIAIRGGHVIRNGQSESEPPTLPCGPDEQTACEYPKAITVPAGHYYVMADNRAAAKEDSRVFGAVPQEAVLGTVEGG